MLQLKYKGKRWRKPSGKIASKEEVITFLENRGYEIYDKKKLKTSYHKGILKRKGIAEKIYCFLQLVSTTNTRTKSRSVIEYRVEVYTEERQDPVYIETELTNQEDKLIEMFPLKGNARLIKPYNYEINDKREIADVGKHNLNRWRGYAEYRNQLSSGRIRVYLYEAEGNPLRATRSSKYTINLKNKSFVEG